MPYIYLYGTRVVYDDIGRGRPVFLVADEASRWPAELPSGFRFIIPDLPGHGRTGGVRLSPEEAAEFLVGMMTMLNLSQAPVVARGEGVAVAEALSERMDLAQPCVAEDDSALARCLDRFS